MATKTLEKIKTEMVFNKDLTHLVDVMKSIAGSQYHLMERKRSKIGAFKAAIQEIFQVYDFRLAEHPFIRIEKGNEKKLICVVTTDFGFLGGLNMKVIQTALKYQNNQTNFLIIGERGTTYMREFGFSYSSLPGINPDDTRFDLVEKVRREMFRAVIKENYGQVILVYPNSTSISSHKVQALNILPCPVFYKDRSEQIVDDEEQAKNMILESPANGIIEYLTSLWIRARLIEIFESSKLSEYGARMMHLEDSFQTLSKADKQLKLDFFKARREKIDQSLRETATATLMLKEL